MSGIISTIGSRTGVVGSDGHVIQVKWVQKTSGASNATSSQTYTDHINLVLAITPTSSSNKILILANPNLYIENHSTDEWSTSKCAIERTIESSVSVVFNTGDNLYSLGRHTTSDTDRMVARQPISYLDSPNTTLSTSYQIQFNSMFGNPVKGDQAFGFSDMILMEIEA